MVLSMNYLAGYFLKAAESFYVKLKPYYLKRKKVLKAPLIKWVKKMNDLKEHSSFKLSFFTHHFS